MRKITCVLLTIYFSFFNITPAYAGKIKTFDDNVQTINRNIEARVYAVKKTKHYTAVEIGFTNTTDKYIDFAPREIYLDDAIKYSQPPLTMADIRSIESKKPGASLFPMALAAALGVASIATSQSNGDVAWGLGMASLGLGAATLLTKGFENRAKQNKFIAIQNNKIDDIKRIPPGMTLGGVMYFPPTKKPQSITVVVKDNHGKYERKVFDIGKDAKSAKKSRRAKLR